MVRSGKRPGAPWWGPEAHTEACKAEGGKGGMGAWPLEGPAEPEVLIGKEEVELEDEKNKEAGGPCEKLLMSSQISSSSLLDDFGKEGGVK